MENKKLREKLREKKREKKREKMFRHKMELSADAEAIIDDLTYTGDVAINYCACCNIASGYELTYHNNDELIYQCGSCLSAIVKDAKENKSPAKVPLAWDFEREAKKFFKNIRTGLRNLK